MIIKTNKDEIQNYLSDASNFRGNCDSVYFPQNAEEVAEILSKASGDNIPVTVAGNGTGLTGARVPEEGIVIATDLMNKIIGISEEELTAVVEPGVLLSDFVSHLKKLNLLYPPDPTERNCYIGGTIATNASGAKTFRYGPTRDYVVELEIVLPDGNIIDLTRGKDIAHVNKAVIECRSGEKKFFDLPDYAMPETKNACGYFCKPGMDLVDLFIGSEGTLGVITKAKLKIVKAPAGLVSCVVFFKNEDDGLTFIEKARSISSVNIAENISGKIDALALEFFDKNSLKFLAPLYPNIKTEFGAAVWFEQESESELEDKIIDEWTELIQKCNADPNDAWFALSEKDRNKIEEFRHAVSWKVNEYIAAKNVKKLGTDVAVPHNKFNELYYLSKKLVEESGIDYVVYGHFGNSHMHLNMLPENEEQYFMGRSVYRMICEAAVNFGGTISAEHGVGKIKKDFLLMMYGEENINKMKAIKNHLDPKGIMGRGNIF